MSCSVCAGYSSDNCPCCSDNARMIDCPDCEGSGGLYYAFHIVERRFEKVNEYAYACLPIDEDDALNCRQNWCQGHIDKCPTCNGEGEIPEDY